MTPTATTPITTRATPAQAGITRLRCQDQARPSNMCVLEGFPTTSNKSVNPVNFPFGIWYANANTLYVADEGDGFTGPGDIYTHAAGQTLAGLEKWTFNSAAGKWELAYTLTSGLNIGTPYTVPGYPTGNGVRSADVE